MLRSPQTCKNTPCKDSSNHFYAPKVPQPHTMHPKHPHLTYSPTSILLTMMHQDHPLIPQYSLPNITHTMLSASCKSPLYDTVYPGLGQLGHKFLKLNATSGNISRVFLTKRIKEILPISQNFACQPTSKNSTQQILPLH